MTVSVPHRHRQRRPAGTDYRSTSGELVFAAGTASGATMTFQVMTTGRQGGRDRRPIPLELVPETAAIAADQTVRWSSTPTACPYLDPKLPADKRVADLLGRMTLAEKVGQMTQAERNALQTQSDIATVAPRVAAVRRWFGARRRTRRRRGPTWWTPTSCAPSQTRLQIPLIYGVDAVHGHNNVVGATIFPHNIGLGATRDPALVEQVGATHRDGGPRHRHPVGLLAVPVRAPATTGGAAPTRASARTPRWSTQMDTVITGCRGRIREATTASSPPRSTGSATAARRTARRPPAATRSTRASPR